MKSAQALATMAWLFPLASMAASSTGTSSSPSSASSGSGNAWPTDLAPTPPTDKEMALWKNLGCFKAVPGKDPMENPLSSDGTGMRSPSRTFNSIGYCTVTFGCTGWEYAAVVQGNACYCAPAMDTGLELVDDENCNVPCRGYSQETCGGVGYLQVYENLNPPNPSKPGSEISDNLPASTSSSSSVPLSGSGGAPASSTSSDAPAASSSVPAAANSNPVAQSFAWLAAAAGMALFL